MLTPFSSPAIAGAGALIASEPTSGAARSWRDVLPIHPAANKIPEASDNERRGLTGDLARHGLKVPVVLVRVGGGPQQLLDGRHRLDLLEGAGMKVVAGGGGVLVKHEIVDVADDAEAERLSLSLNAHRRHLPADERRRLLQAQLKATPEKSDRAIGAIVGYSDKTVAKERRDLAGRSEIPNVETKTDTKGRAQPAKRNLEKERRAREERKRKARGDLPSLEETLATPIEEPIGPMPPAAEVVNGNGVDPEVSAAQRKAAADEETSPTDEQAPASGSMSKAEKKRRNRVASWMENTLDDLDLVISAVANEPDLIDADLLDRLQTRAAEFIEIARRARAQQAIGGGK